MRMETEKVRDYLKRADLYTYMGRIDKIVGTTVEATGPECRIGDVCTIEVAGSSREMAAEVVGFRENKVLLMPLRGYRRNRLRQRGSQYRQQASDSGGRQPDRTYGGRARPAN